MLVFSLILGFCCLPSNSLWPLSVVSDFNCIIIYNFLDSFSFLFYLFCLQPLHFAFNFPPQYLQTFLPAYQSSAGLPSAGLPIPRQHRCPIPTTPKLPLASWSHLSPWCPPPWQPHCHSPSLCWDHGKEQKEIDNFTAFGFNTMHLCCVPLVYLLSSGIKVISLNSLALLIMLNMFSQPAVFEQPQAQDTTFFLNLPNCTDVFGEY